MGKEIDRWMSPSLAMCGRVRFTAHGLYLQRLNIKTEKKAKSSRIIPLEWIFTGTLQTIQHNCVCAGVRSCHPLCELLWGMNLATTVMVWFIALHPQHNLALRSDGPISRQIAQHPTVTRNARCFPRIINDRNYMWLLRFCFCTWKYFFQMKIYCSVSHSRPNPAFL